MEYGGEYCKGGDARSTSFKSNAGDHKGPPLGIKRSCAGGAPPRMKDIPLLPTCCHLGRDFQKNLSLEARQEAG